MRLLTIIVAIVASLYSGYWFIGANAVETGSQNAIENARTDGWQIQYDDLNTRGFPSRFDTTITDIDISAPEGVFSYKASILQALALSYAPNEIILAFADQHEIAVGQQTLDIETTGLRASASVAANSAASLQAITAEVAPISIASTANWATHIDKLLFAMRPVEGKTAIYDAYLTGNGFTVPEAVSGLLNTVGGIAPTVQSVTIDLELTLDRDLDRHAIAEIDASPPIPQSMSLRNVAMNWGEMWFSAKGDLIFDAAGIPEGKIDVSAIKWKQMIQVMAELDLIDPGISPLIESVANNLAGGDQDLQIPIHFRDGQTFIGPWPLGPAPRFF